MNFRSSEILYSRINKYLSAFTNSSDIDENDWYYYTKSVLKRLNVEGTSLAETVLAVDNYKCYLPDDFSSLWALWKAKGKNETKTIYREHQQDKLIFYYEDTCLKNTNEGYFSSNLIPTGTPNVIMRDVFVGEELEEREYYEDVQLLKLVNKKNGFCVEGCLNKNCENENEFHLKENTATFNFKEGTVLIQYFAFPKDEDGLPMIPDDIRIEEAIEYYIIYKELEKKFISGEENVLQRLQYAQLKNDEKFNVAKTHLHLPSWKSMIDYAYKNQTKNHKYITPEVRRMNSWWYNPYLVTASFNNFTDAVKYRK